MNLYVTDTWFWMGLEINHPLNLNILRAQMASKENEHQYRGNTDGYRSNMLQMSVDAAERDPYIDYIIGHEWGNQCDKIGGQIF
jgi:hypothetical protein